MKLSFVNQPWTIAAPPARSDSTGIWSYQVCRHLAKRCHISYYGCKTEVNSDRKREYGFSSAYTMEYRAISPRIDDLLTIPRKILSKLTKLPYFASVWYYFGYAWQIARHTAENNDDVIHIHNFSQFAPIIRALNPKSKIVLHLHCEWANRLEKKVIASRLDKVDLVISCSDHITNKIANRFPEYAEICRTVYNGVDADYFVPPPSYHPEDRANSPQILFVGRISPEKGIHDLMDAFIKVTQTYPQAVLTIVGPHFATAKDFLLNLQPEPEVQALEPLHNLNYLEYLKSKIPPHLSSQVVFAGSLPQKQLLPYYQKADVLVNPSLSEAFGMSLVESMATATPVIATKIGGMTEIVEHGVSGLLVEPANSQDLAEAIIEIISEPSRAREMGQAGRKKVLQCYSWEKITQSLVSHYAAIGVNFDSHEPEKEVASPLEKAT